MGKVKGSFIAGSKSFGFLKLEPTYPCSCSKNVWNWSGLSGASALLDSVGSSSRNGFHFFVFCVWGLAFLAPFVEFEALVPLQVSVPLGLFAFSACSPSLGAAGVLGLRSDSGIYDLDIVEGASGRLSSPNV